MGRRPVELTILLWVSVAVGLVVGMLLLLMWLLAPWKNETKFIITGLTIAAGSIIGPIVLVASPLATTNDVASWAQIVGPVLAVVAVVAVAFQIRNDGFRHGVELLIEFQRDYDSASMREMRKAAAESLLRQRTQNLPTPSYDRGVSRVLNFYQMIGILTSKGALDSTLVWDKFFNRVNVYYSATGEYREKRRKEKDTPFLWQMFEQLHSDLHKIDRKERDRHKGKSQPTLADTFINEWLKDEAREQIASNSHSHDDVITKMKEVEKLSSKELEQFDQAAEAKDNSHVRSPKIEAKTNASTNRGAEVASSRGGDTYSEPKSCLKLEPHTQIDLVAPTETTETRVHLSVHLNGEMSFLVLDETKNAYARFVVNNDGTLRQELLE
jgi:hypothetical protein